jgi:hypothetical protein
MAHGGLGTVMKNETTIELFLYWNRLRGTRPAPRRTEIEPADIRTRLADTFILEGRANGAAKFRLAGTRLCAIFCRELKGFEFGTVISDRDHLMISRLIQATVREGTVCVIGLEGTARNNRHLTFELLLLPLQSEGEGVRILGCMSAMEKPFWLGVDAILRCDITSVRVVDPDREPMFLKNRPEIVVPPLAPEHSDALADRPADVFAGDDVMFLSDRLPSRKVAHLRVYDGGKSEEDEI